MPARSKTVAGRRGAPFLTLPPVLVEDGVVPPPTTRYGPSPLFPPLRDMRVGQSFAFERRWLETVRRACGRYRKRFGNRYTVRQVRGRRYRVWRIA